MKYKFDTDKNYINSLIGEELIELGKIYITFFDDENNKEIIELSIWDENEGIEIDDINFIEKNNKKSLVSDNKIDFDFSKLEIEEFYKDLIKYIKELKIKVKNIYLFINKKDFMKNKGKYLPTNWKEYFSREVYKGKFKVSSYNNGTKETKELEDL